MTSEHWFDRLNKLLTRDAPRRGVVGAAVALVTGHGHGADDAAAKNNGKGGKGGKSGGKGKGGKNNGKGNHKRKGNGNNNQNGNGGSGNGGSSGGGSDPAGEVPPQCGEEICSTLLPQDQWIACVEKCGRCRIRAQFCVTNGDAEHPDMHATCCHEHQQCCQDSRTCCDKSATCCGVGSDLPGAPCCARGETCCVENDRWGCCVAGETCCPGVGCRGLAVDPGHCGACSSPCPPGHVCRNGQCVCEGPECLCLDNLCPRGQRCVSEAGHYCDGQPGGDCACGCGNYYYCYHPDLEWVCQSNPC